MWGTDGRAFSYGIDFLDDSLPELESVCHRLKYIREVHCEIMGNLRDPYMSLETCPWFPDSWGREGTMIGNLMSKPYVLGKLNNLNGKII